MAVEIRRHARFHFQMNQVPLLMLCTSSGRPQAAAAQAAGTLAGSSSSSAALVPSRVAPRGTVTPQLAHHFLLAFILQHVVRVCRQVLCHTIPHFYQFNLLLVVIDSLLYLFTRVATCAHFGDAGAREWQGSGYEPQPFRHGVCCGPGCRRRSAHHASSDGSAR